ncbi:hypothetical protein F5B18DRAFT_229681 [Nemania serpens]|nr:hypothetical protein F5B18DRAFT_229681 [Nemania serpens]
MTMATATQIMQSSALTAHSQSTATTAPVREHVCLFTHDLRRKQKRWQDGRLKYHTFNRRVMVYDERGNFVGDTHWREDYDLADGDDLELDRGSIIIQVGECVGSRDQDLSDLIDKRAQERAQRQAAATAAAARRPPTAPVTPLHVAQPPSLPQKHLHDVIGTPSGHHGRAAIPKESPYEERRQRQAQPQSDDTRPAKRQRRDISPPSKSGYAQNLFGATLTLSGRPSSQAPVRYRPLKTSRTQEELTSPPSSTTSNHIDKPATTIDTAQTPAILQNMHAPSLRQMPVLANHAQISTETSAKHHGSMRSEHFSHINPDLPDESGTSPIIEKKRPKSIVDQARKTKTNYSVLDLRSTNQKIRKSKGTNEALEKADSRIHQPGTPFTINVSKIVRGDKRAGAGNGGIQGHRSQDANLIDLTEGEVGIPRPQPCHDEPRTELRIKPRKKRGLLMVSERHAVRNTSPNSEPSKTGPDVHRLPLPSTAQSATALTDKRDEKARSANMQHNKNQKNVPRRKKMVRNDDWHNDDAGDAGDDNGRHQSSCVIEDDEMGGMQCLDQTNPEPRKEAELQSTIEQGDTPMAESQAQETGRRLRPRKQLITECSSFSSDNDDYHERLTFPRARRRDDATVEEKPAPRLTKLARKSIKSREVIGFIFSDEPDPSVGVKQDSHAQSETGLDIQLNEGTGRQCHRPEDKLCDNAVATELRSNAAPQSPRNDTLVAGEPIRLQRQHSGQPKPPNDERSPTVQSEEVLSMVTTTTIKQNIPPIINPATRGRKAAKPSDAAGQMPICPLPIELVRNQSLHQNPRKRNAQGNPDTESAIPMPSFSRANGGPWSREAHDLFDFKRPS